MSRWVKLFTLAVAGYFLYEMYRGLTSRMAAAMDGADQETDFTAPEPMGTPVHVEDSDGATMTRHVGRGVVHRKAPAR